MQFAIYQFLGRDDNAPVVVPVALTLELTPADGGSGHITRYARFLESMRESPVVVQAWEQHLKELQERKKQQTQKREREEDDDDDDGPEAKKPRLMEEETTAGNVRMLE